MNFYEEIIKDILKEILVHFILQYIEKYLYRSVLYEDDLDFLHNICNEELVMKFIPSEISIDMRG
ncbi:MAG: hypothetical protein KH611_02290 [Clostridium sp.]|nr:hypothetical protein [Clostridium sp.]